VSNVRLKQLEGMSLQEIIEFVTECGYGTESLSNDEIYELAVEILDGHESEDAFEELDFSD
jgi:hypothetical protein